MKAELFARQRDQRTEDHRRRSRVIQRCVRRLDVEPEVGDQALKARHLSLREVHHKPRERARIDDRMLERALEAATDEPRVERVVAVLDEHRAV